MFLEAGTCRMGGHATHDVREARRTFDPEMFAHWGRRDPIGLYEDYLVHGGLDLGGGYTGPAEILARLTEIEEDVIAEIDRAAAEALQSRDEAMPAGASAASGVYAR